MPWPPKLQSGAPGASGPAAPLVGIGGTRNTEAHQRTVFGADAVPLQVAELANVAVRRALTLAPGLADAQAQSGWARYWYHFDWPGAEQALRIATAANASVLGAHLGLANLLLSQGRIEQGFDHMRLARELDPLNPLANALEAGFLLAAGRFEQARLRLSHALDVAPNFWVAHTVEAYFQLARGQTDAGLAALRKAVLLAPTSSQPLSSLGMYLARVGQTDEARRS